MGQSAPVAETDLHFTCFIEAPEQDFRKAARQEEVPATAMLEQTTGMRLIELDGRRAGPIDHGECGDLLSVSSCILCFGSGDLCGIILGFSQAYSNEIHGKDLQP